MTLATSLVRLYPSALRDRWGAGLEAEVRAGGWRTVPNVLAGILTMWLHPVVWPARSAAQRRSRAAVVAFVIAFSGWLVGHVLVDGETLLPRAVTHSWPLRLSDVLVFAGLLLAAPYPRLNLRAIGRLLRHGVKRLLVPATLGTAVVAWANLAGDHASLAARHGVLAAWWAILVTGSVQACRLVADLGQGAAAPPPVRRLVLGLGLVVAGLAVGGLVVVLFAVGRGLGAVLAGALGSALILLTVSGLFTLRDLDEVLVLAE
jgi:hypothetical protein